MRRVLGSLGLLPVLMLLLASSTLAARPANAFVGSWTGTDIGDGSIVTLTVVGDGTVQATLIDDYATSACAHASTPIFRGKLVGKVDGSVMVTKITAAKCGTEPVPFLHGVVIEWWLDDSGTEVLLYNSFGEEYSRTN
jgi:hypothetical protein